MSDLNSSYLALCVRLKLNLLLLLDFLTFSYSASAVSHNKVYSMLYDVFNRWVKLYRLAV